MSKSYAKIYAVALLLLFSASTAWWHLSDTRPSSRDETRHMELAIDYRNWIKRDTPLLDGWSHVYPPLYHLSIIPALSVGIPSEGKVAMTYLFDAAVLLAGCILLGRRARRPDWESVLAAFLVVGYEYVLYVSRRALIDFPLTAWTTLCIALLSLTEGFSSLPNSLLWGASLGLGLLIKAPFAFFLIGPVLWVYGVSEQPGKTKNAGFSLLLAAAICLPWYFWQSAYFLSKGLSLAAEVTGPGTAPHHLSGWTYYFGLLRLQMGVWSLLFTAIGLGLAARRRLEGVGLLIAWMASGYFILSLLINKDPRHSLPLLPALAILSTRGWGSFADRPWKIYLLTLMGPCLLIYNLLNFDRPAKEDWEHASILSLMMPLHDASLPFLSASILSSHPQFFARSLRWTAYQDGIDLKTVSPGDSTAGFAEFIVQRLGDQGREAAVLDRQWQDLIPSRRAFLSLFSVCGRFPLPDGSEAVVYRRDPRPRFHVSPLTDEAMARHVAQALRQVIRGPLIVTVKGRPGELSEGRLIQARLACEGCEISGLRVRKLDIAIEKPWFNLYRLWDEGRLGLLAFEFLQPSIILSQADVQARLSDVKGLSDVRVQLEDGHVQVQARYKKIPVGAQAHLSLDSPKYPALNAVLDWVRVGPVRLPGWLLGKAHRQTLWLYPLPDFPGRILIHRATIEKDELHLS